MRKNVQKVWGACLEGRPAKGDSKATISTDGMRVFSYSTLIGIRLGKTYHMSIESWSRTTSSQLNGMDVLMSTLCKVVKHRQKDLGKISVALRLGAPDNGNEIEDFRALLGSATDESYRDSLVELITVLGGV